MSIPISPIHDDPADDPPNLQFLIPQDKIDQQRDEKG